MLRKPFSADTEILGDCRGFETTRWSLVRAIGDLDALGALIAIYWKPLYFYVRRQGYDNESAKDAVQSFLTALLERESFTRADPSRGKFRTFLLASLNNFLKDWAKSASRLKRGGGATLLSLDFAGGEREYALQVSKGEPPEAILNRAWARSLLEQSVSELQGQPAHVEAFRLWLADVDLEKICEKTGLSEPAAKSAIHRLKGELRDIVTARVRQTAGTEEDLRAEIAEFVSLFP